MIVREDEKGGGLLLVTQTEHSQFVGQLAAHWGNERFASPEPFESVARAATYHDFGYLQWEPDPPFDAAKGRPHEFRTLPTTDRRLAAYQWCIDWLRGIDPYSGLLVSMHRTGLWLKRYGAIDHPPAREPGALAEDVRAFIARCEAQQAEERRPFDAAALRVNYQLLQVWDLLGLYFGCQEPFYERIWPVPTGYGASAPVTLELRNLGRGKVSLDPFPFDVPGLRVQMRGKRLASKRYPDEASFRKAYYQATSEALEFELV